MYKKKLWTKNFIGITVISFLMFLVFYVLLTALPLYLVGTLHTGTDKVGLASDTIFPSSYYGSTFCRAVGE